MKACIRCGVWHTTAESSVGRYMSCSEVKLYWSDLKNQHLQDTGHLAVIKIGKDGTITCLKCGCAISGIP